MRRVSHWVLAPLLALCACSQGVGEMSVASSATFSSGANVGSTGATDTTRGGSSSSAAPTTEVTSGGTSSGDSTSNSSSSSSSGAGGEIVPCTAIDFLFVVDNSGTMVEEQLRLRAAAPDFIAAVRDNLPEVTSVQIGAISTDTPALAVSAAKCGPFVGMAGFMTQDDDLPMTLGCAVEPGVTGSPDERPIDMLLAAIDDLANQSGGLNSDFVRKPALLVLVILTDEEDDHEQDLDWGSEGDPPAWFDAVTAVKDGYAQDFVVLSLVGTPKPNACPPFQWDGEKGAELAPRLAEFTKTFPFGQVGDVCAPSYDSFLFDVVPLVVDACASFVPVE